MEKPENLEGADQASEEEIRSSDDKPVIRKEHPGFYAIGNQTMSKEEYDRRREEGSLGEFKP